MSEDNTTKFSMSELIERIGAKPLREQDRLNVELIDLRQFKKDALEVIKMVADNRKMPHQHKDYHTRLCCLAERANEFLEKYKQWLS